jgi:hypothetical protein
MRAIWIQWHAYSTSPLGEIAVLQRHYSRFVVEGIAPETLVLVSKTVLDPCDDAIVTYKVKVGDYVCVGLDVACNVVDVVEVDVVPARRAVLYGLHGL